jgi:small subunit ribosomal protein S3
MRRLLHEDLKLSVDLKAQLQAMAGRCLHRSGAHGEHSCASRFSRRAPGIIIGRKGAEIDKLKVDIQKRTQSLRVYINIQEIHRPELDAHLVAESIAMQLEKTHCFPTSMRKSVDSALRFGAKGSRCA